MIVPVPVPVPLVHRHCAHRADVGDEHRRVVAGVRSIMVTGGAMLTRWLAIPVPLPAMMVPVTVGDRGADRQVG